MLRVAQGTVLVRYDQLLEIEVIDADAARDVPKWSAVIAPITGGGSPELATWLAEAATGMPGMTWIVGGDSARDAASCAGAMDCLAEKAQTAGADYLVASVYSPSEQRLQIRGVHLSQTSLVGEVALLVPEDREDAAPALLGAVFAALGMRPEIDLRKASKGSFAVATAPEPEPTPESEPAPEPEPEPEPIVATPESGPVVKKITRGGAKPEPKQTTRRVFTRTRPALTYERSRGALVVMGFAPIPGLTSAYLGDTPGFVVSLTGTVALSALSVYALGSTIRWRDPFIATSVLVPYAITVLFNEIAGLVGWNRLYGNASIAQARRPVAGIAPVFAQQGKAPTGATLTFGARF